MSSVELTANGTKQKFTEEKKTTVKTVERVFLLIVFDAGPSLLKADYCNTALDNGLHAVLTACYQIHLCYL